MCPPSLMCPRTPPYLPVHDNTTPAAVVGFAWRKAPYYIAAPIDRRLRATRAASRVPAFPVQREERSTPRMAKKRSEPRKMSTPTPFEQARDELFSHILRCGVLEGTPEHQKEWFDDTMLYLAERYDALDEQQLAELRVLGERYCRPVVGRSAPVGANA